jgi:hypothetical protein
MEMGLSENNSDLFLKMAVYTCLFHNFICRMPRLYPSGNRETVISFGTIPHIMIAFTASKEITAVF